MVVQESFVTRRPIAFLFIVLLIILAVYIPVRFFVLGIYVEENIKVTLNESYPDVWRWYDQDSPLTTADKAELFANKYKGKVIEWQGTLLACKELEGVYSVKMQQRELDGFADVVFSTQENCTARQTGLMMRYRMELLDLKVNVFVGKNGKIIA